MKVTVFFGLLISIYYKKKKKANETVIVIDVFKTAFNTHKYLNFFKFPETT